MYSESIITVRYAETDRMGIVHHSNYPVWFEVGRTEFIKKLGISYSEIEKRGIMLPLIRLECSYRGSATYEDRIIVRTSVRELKPTRITFYYEVVKEGEEKPITTGTTEHAWTNRDLRPINLKKVAPDILELISKSTGSPAK